MNERSNDMLQSKKQSVFLVGAKSLGNYGGYETFVDKLTEYHQNNTSIKYYVACKANGDGCIDEKKLTDIAYGADMTKSKLADNDERLVRKRIRGNIFVHCMNMFF